MTKNLVYYSSGPYRGRFFSIFETILLGRSKTLPYMSEKMTLKCK